MEECKAGDERSRDAIFVVNADKMESTTTVDIEQPKEAGEKGDLSMPPSPLINQEAVFVSERPSPGPGAELEPAEWKENHRNNSSMAPVSETTRRKRSEQLPQVECCVRARIPTTRGNTTYLYLYNNSEDDREHLAIVFGDDIRSKSLDAERPGETELDRMTRGAYLGRLYPGRTTSRLDNSENDHSVNGENGHLVHNQNDHPVNDKVEKSQLQSGKDVPLVRIHSECYTGETAWSARCDCGEQLDEAARLMSEAGRGVIVYLRQEGRGIGLGEKLKAYNLQDLGNDTVQANLLLRHPADARSYSVATSILLDLGLTNIALLTNNPDKIAALEGGWSDQERVHVIERVPMTPKWWRGDSNGVHGDELRAYLNTKVKKLGHDIDLNNDTVPHV